MKGWSCIHQELLASILILMVMTRCGFKIVRKNHLHVECSGVE